MQICYSKCKVPGQLETYFFLVVFFLFSLIIPFYKIYVFSLVIQKYTVKSSLRLPDFKLCDNTKRAIIFCGRRGCQNFENVSVNKIATPPHILATKVLHPPP